MTTRRGHHGIHVSDAEGQKADWPQARWTRILDRLEHRQADIGLKFWGPPLWLEVTMTGPDSDRWPAKPESNDSWNWHSSQTCTEAESLLQQGADDDQLVVAVGRYTVENLVLNAVHEIGEWLRFDGRRVFPAHPAAQAWPPADAQGNGSVQLIVTFTPAAGPAGRPPRPADQTTAQCHLRRPHLLQLTELAGPPSRFTYLPATSIDYDTAGPVIRLHCDARPATEWRAAWSTATVQALQSDVDAQTLIGFVQRDVHGALVAWEADRICRAFYIDHRRPWRLCAPGLGLGNESTTDGEVDEGLTLTITYLEQPNGSTQKVAPVHRAEADNRVP